MRWAQVRAVEKFGQPELADRLLKQAVAGKQVLAVAMSEPEAGSAATDMTTTCRPATGVAAADGGSLVLNGQKRWCSGGGYSDLLVLCRLDPAADDAKALGAVYVPADTPGVSYGQAETLMGFRGVPSADIFFDDVAVGPEAVVLQVRL